MLPAQKMLKSLWNQDIAAIFVPPVQTDVQENISTFQKALVTESRETLSRLLVKNASDIDDLLSSTVEQATRHYQAQVQTLQQNHAREVGELNKHLSNANEQLAETVKKYNQVVTNLKTELENVKVELAEKEAAYQSQIGALSNQVISAEEQLEESSKTYKTLLQDLSKQASSAKDSARDGELKWQQKKLIMVQTLEQQRKELQELKAKLDAEQHRNAKLTQLSQHLLQKRSESARARVSSSPPPGASTLPSALHPTEHGATQPAAAPQPPANVMDQLLSELTISSSAAPAVHSSDVDESAGPIPPPAGEPPAGKADYMPAPTELVSAPQPASSATNEIGGTAPSEGGREREGGGDDDSDYESWVQ